MGCTKTRNWEIRNGKWGNAEMGNGGQKHGPHPPLRPRYSWPYGRQGERRLRSSGRGRGLVRASVLANPSRAQLELTGNHFRSRF